MNKKRNQGFTLIELLLVISIISLLSSVVFSSISTARRKAYVAAGQQFSGQVYRSMGDTALVIWNFDGGTSAFDDSGNGYAGTITGATYPSPAVTPLNKGNSLLFSAGSVLYPSSGTVSLPFNVGANLIHHTVSLWIRSNIASLNDNCVLDIRGCNDRCINFWVSNNGSRITFGHRLFSVPGGDWAVYNSSSAVFPNGQWVHAAYTWDGSNDVLYINGKEVYRLPRATALSPTITSIRVGSYGGSYPFSGYIDEFAVYKQALTASEIHKIYARSAPAHGIALSE